MKQTESKRKRVHAHRRGYSVLFVCKVLGGASDLNKARAVHAFYMNIHIGNIIKQELDRQERGVSWLARKINLHRTTVHAILNKESINTELLLKISYALETNLFEKYYSHLSKKFPQK